MGRPCTGVWKKVKIFVRKSYIIGHNFINPIYGCGVKKPYNNPICGLVGRPCSEISTNV